MARSSQEFALQSPDRFGLSRALVRIGFVIFGLVGVGELVYIILWILIPRATT